MDIYLKSINKILLKINKEDVKYISEIKENIQKIINIFQTT